MTCKQFFKSTTFKCIAVLVCIALVSGGLLAILNDLWKVTDEERINRAIASVCGKDVQLKETIALDESYSVDTGIIEKDIYYLSNDAYLLTVTGNNGYHSGTIELYVLAKLVDEEFKIDTVSISSYASSQTLMSKFNSASLEKFVSNPSYIEGGATYSSNAVRNAIKTANSFLDEKMPSLAKEA